MTATSNNLLRRIGRGHIRISRSTGITLAFDNSSDYTAVYENGVKLFSGTAEHITRAYLQWIIERICPEVFFAEPLILDIDAILDGSQKFSFNLQLKDEEKYHELYEKQSGKTDRIVIVCAEEDIFIYKNEERLCTVGYNCAVDDIIYSIQNHSSVRFKCSLLYVGPVYNPDFPNCADAIAADSYRPFDLLI